jgi:feruloyl esterase
VGRPTSDSEIRIEVWLPASGWNSRYQQAGNGGWAGGIPSGALAQAVRRGYAAAGTDDGHKSDGTISAAWAIGHPEKLIDFGYRALGETAATAKAVIRAFYGKDPAYSYFVGCSDGGREALMVAQRFPEEFNGVISGAPANDWSHLFTGFVWDEQALLGEPGSWIPPAKLPVIYKAALASCDGQDGVKDGLLEDPSACRFDPSILTGKDADGPDCLTPKQVAALKRIYTGPVNPRTGKSIYPGYPPGSEGFAWVGPLIADPPEKASQFQFGNSYYGQAVFENPNWDFRKLDFDTDVAFGDAKAGAILNSASPDLRSFRARGGKLIQYHGWADALVTPLGSVEYYRKVEAFLTKFPDARSDASRPVRDFYRLFMVPGMGHCAGGIGPCNFGNSGSRGAAGSGDPESDILAALEHWVEKGIAPGRIIGRGTAVGDSSKPLTRPLCPYPQVARYNGSGDPNDAASFACAAPGR